MKSFCFILILLFSTLAFSQKLECCKTVIEVGQIISGKWKAVGGDSSEIFVYSFKNNKGDLEINYELSNDTHEDEENIVIGAHDPIVEILKKKKRFKLKYTYMLETILADIKFLSFDKMILLENKTKTEYYKIFE